MSQQINQQEQQIVQKTTVAKRTNPVRVEQGKRLVEYNRRKKKELKKLNERINKQEETDTEPLVKTNSRESNKTSIPTGVFITGLFLVGVM